MSDLDNAINSINASAAKAENTATFLDDMSTFDDQSSVTNPNNGQTVASIPKQVKDRTDELFTAAESDINQAVSDAEQSATDAQDAADSIGRYQGLWPDTGGIADKGDTYQTQVSGTPTGQYFTALQNTTSDPIGDDVNWREVVSIATLPNYTDIVYKASGGNSAVDNMIAGIPVKTLAGQTCQCENGSIFERVSELSGDIKDFIAASSLYVKDFGAKSGVECFLELKAASEAASNGGVIMYGVAGDNFFTSDGEIPLFSNQRHIFNGATLSRPNPSEINKYAIFKDEVGVDNVVFKGGFLSGNSDDTVGAVNPESSCIHLKYATNILLYDMNCQGGASGLQVYGCDDVRVYDSELTLSKLSGVSGISNRVKIKRSKVKSNGFSSGGFTHEIYMTNSSNCEVTDSEIGDNLDSSFSLFIKNETSETTYTGFTSCKNWVVKGNSFFNDRGVNFTNASSEGELQQDQQPHIGHVITNNNLTDGAGVKISSPQDCIISGNSGDSLSVLSLVDSSTYPSYAPSAVSNNNVIGSIAIGVLTSSDTSSWKEKARFNHNTLLTSGDAINRQESFGGSAYGLFDSIYTPNTSSPFSVEVNSDYNNGNIIFIGGGDYPSLVVSQVSATINGSPYTPSVKGKGLGVQMFGTVNAATINDTDSVPDGSILEFGMQQNGSGSNRAITFDANYRLTDAWEVNKDINEPGQFFFISFIRRGGVWHQLYECGWT